MKREYDESNMMSCPFAGVQKIIHGKWAMVIFPQLSIKTGV